MKPLLIINLVLVILLSSCSSSIESTSTAVPEINEQQPLPKVISNSELGIVTGKLLFEEDETAIAQGNVPLFLAEILLDDNGIPRVASMNRTESPRSATDSQGQFVFSNIPPGEYGLVLDIVVKAYLLPKPGSEEDLIVSVKPGEITDLGTLTYDISIMPGTTGK